MRSGKKIIALCAAVLMLVMAVPPVYAVDNVSVDAGKTAELIFTFSDVYNVDGKFTINDPKNIVSSYTVSVADAGATAAMVSGNLLWASPGAEPVRTTVRVKVEVAVKSGAEGGAACTVAFSGIYGDANKAVGNEQESYQSATVTVNAAAVQPGTSDTPTTPVTPPPTVKPTPGSTTDPKPGSGQGSSNVDYTELNKKIAVAEGLNLNEYNDDSRKALTTALTEARSALSSKDQSMVSNAAKKLQNALSGLKKMDYTKLQSALDRADNLLVSEQTVILWQKLSDAARKGIGLLESGDQAAVDAVTAELIEILDALEKDLDIIQKTQVVVQEVPVTVLPDSDYCNIESHHIWPAAFVASLVVNVLLLGVIAFMVIRRIRNQKDDTPLVDYDIDEDL